MPSYAFLILACLSTAQLPYGHRRNGDQIATSLIQTNSRSDRAISRTNARALLREDCDPQVPEYNMADWVAAHGKQMPDHPAIFRGHYVADGFEKYADLNTFIEAFGDDAMTFYPEYGQPGGFGAQYWNHAVETQPIRDIVANWNKTHAYAGYFVCKESTTCTKMYDHLGVPSVFEGPKSSINFLVGGPDTGLPFHWHEKTWQGLLSGRKAWYLVPPDAMTQDLHDLTGPLLLPARGWTKLVDDLPLGKRPIRCVQHPGDILYFPDNWYHATQNLDKFQLGWGAKPDKREQITGSKELAAIRAVFTPSKIKFDTFPSQLTGHFEEYQRNCMTDHDKSAHVLDSAFEKLITLAREHQDAAGNTATVETLAFALCAISLKMDQKPAKQCKSSAALATKWQKMAHEMSETVSKKECVPF